MKEKSSSLSLQKKDKEAILDLFNAIGKSYNKEVSSIELELLFNLAQMDIDRGKFTWDEFRDGIYMCLSEEHFYPKYSMIYQKIMAPKQRIKDILWKEDCHNQWAILMKTDISVLNNDPVLYTAGVKSRIKMDVKHASEFEITRLKERFFDLLTLIRDGHLEAQCKPKQLGEIVEEGSKEKAQEGFNIIKMTLDKIKGL